MEITIGEAISQRRKVLHLTQAQLAQRYGISDKAVSKWERNLSKPDAAHLCDLAQFLGLPREYLPEDKAEDISKPSFWGAIKGEIGRIFCVAIVLAAVVCLWNDSLTVESAVYLIGASCAAFGFITVIKS